MMDKADEFVHLFLYFSIQFILALNLIQEIIFNYLEERIKFS